MTFRRFDKDDRSEECDAENDDAVGQTTLKRQKDEKIWEMYDQRRLRG